MMMNLRAKEEDESSIKGERKEWNKQDTEDHKMDEQETLEIKNSEMIQDSWEKEFEFKEDKKRPPRVIRVSEKKEK